jgi:hypothetical protein
VKDEPFLTLSLIGLAFIILAGISKYIDDIPFSPPHIEAPAYVWAESCEEARYRQGALDCACEREVYKVSSWRMLKFGINPQRSDGLYRIGNDLLEIAQDTTGICTRKHIYRSSFYQKR